MTDFDAKLATFVEGAQAICDAYHTRMGYKPFMRSVLSIDPKGRRYKRIVRTDANGSGRCVHCFVDTQTGDVLKPASWKAPAKHARGNIFDDRNGLGMMGEYGPAYLR